MNRLLLTLVWAVAAPAAAEEPQRILAVLMAEAGGKASPMQGEKLFRGKFSGGKSAASCTDCHGDDPKLPGRHNQTHKVIAPLAPVVQGDRFSDAAKVEKWFRRNCPEVMGRACTPREKADFTAYMISLR
jgi:hypothetical protein